MDTSECAILVMFANWAISVAAVSASMLVAMSRPLTTWPNSSSSSMEKPSCAPSAWMSSICDADTALVLLNSIADCLSAWYCSSVPSTVLRTPVRDVSILTAAATDAPAAAPMAGVTVRVSALPMPAMTVLAPLSFEPNFSRPVPALPSRLFMERCCTMDSVSAALYFLRFDSASAMSDCSFVHCESSIFCLPLATSASSCLKIFSCF